MTNKKQYSDIAYLTAENCELFENLIRAVGMTGQELAGIAGNQTEGAIHIARRKKRIKKIFANNVLESDFFKLRRNRLVEQVNLLAQYKNLRF